MKTLVYVPLNPCAGRETGPEVIDSILGMEPHGSVSYHFEESRFSNELHTDVTAKYQLARRLVLRGKYDALLTIEDDMLVPPETLFKLQSLNVDIAYGLYAARSMPRHPWLVAFALDLAFIMLISDMPDYAKRCWGKVIHSQGIGMGCTLIRRHVLEEIDFRHMPGAGYGHGKACDWYFALDALEKGFIQKTDMGLVCGHIKNNGMVLYPDPTQEKLYREEVL